MLPPNAIQRKLFLAHVEVGVKTGCNSWPIESDDCERHFSLFNSWSNKLGGRERDSPLSRLGEILTIGRFYKGDSKSTLSSIYSEPSNSRFFLYILETAETQSLHFGFSLSQNDRLPYTKRRL